MKKFMGKNKKGYVLGLVILIAILLCAQTFAIAIEINTNNRIKSTDSFFRDSVKVPFEVIELGEAPLKSNYAGNVLVSINSPEEDRLPDITSDQNGDFVVTWTHEVSILDGDIGFAFSGDNGNLWDSYLIGLESFQKYANSALIDTTKHEGEGTYNGIMGSWIDPLGETYGVYRMPDIYDDSTWEFGSWADGGSPGIEYNKVEDDSFYLMTYYDQYSMVMAGVYDGNELDRGIVCHWLDTIEFGGSVENWDAESAQVSGPVQDPDMANVHDTDPAVTQGDYFYLVWQRNNPDSGKAEILYKEVVPLDESDIEYVTNFGAIDAGSLYDCAHPDAEASSSRAVVAYMTNNNVYGDWDIGIAYTTDRGQTWNTGTFAANTPQIDELYPALYMSGNTVYCAYISDGNLFLVTSEDGGLNWGDPEQINEQAGSVVAEENSLDLSSEGIVWTDNRNGDMDIYYSPLGSGPAVPSTPDGPTTVRKNRQQTYSSSSDDTATHILFDWDDGTDSGWLTISGGVAEGSHAWGEDGDYQIKAKAKNANDVESPWSDPLPISVPRDRPLFSSFLMKLLEHFKILRFIF